ncbi:MAG: class I SAM-dependent RNA methyltransferase [Bdellovibrionales bacterium]|nr:class I SAM-dependent RNA methyltransferase [Bdellovibrionales bacterium]
MKPKNSLTPSLPDTVELTIDSLSYNGGRGVGRTDGVVIFVPGTAPGDRVRVRLTVRKPRFAEADLLEILEPSSVRRTPPCPVAGRCGGCSWQHVSYSAQVEQKKKILNDSLRRLQGFEVLPFLAAPAEFHYRNRIQLQIQNGRYGFFGKRSHELVAIEECWIAEPALNEKMRGLSLSDLSHNRRLEIALGEDNKLHLTTGDRDPEAALFSQVNRAQNLVLQQRILQLVQIRPDWLMDLYAGAGNLTLPLVTHFPSVPLLAAELSRASVERGKAKAPAILWRVGDVAKVLRGERPRSGSGLIVLDPPRPGCEIEVIEQLKRHRPQQIIYVSCNPSTFARDAERLLPDYRLEKVQGLDMFPQTEHVELIASLRAAH